MKRFLSVDIAKGISIIAIVLGHINFQYPAGQLVILKIYSFTFGMLQYSFC